MIWCQQSAFIISAVLVNTLKYIFHSKGVWYVFLSLLLVRYLNTAILGHWEVFEKSLYSVFSVCYEPCQMIFEMLLCLSCEIFFGHVQLICWLDCLIFQSNFMQLDLATCGEPFAVLWLELLRGLSNKCYVNWESLARRAWESWKLRHYRIKFLVIATPPVGYCPSTASFSVRPYCENARRDRC